MAEPQRFAPVTAKFAPISARVRAYAPWPVMGNDDGNRGGSSPACQVCGRPVRERDPRTGSAPPCHRACRGSWEHRRRLERERERSAELDESMLRARWSARQAAASWRDDIANRNELVADADRYRSIRAYWLVRTLVLVMRLEPRTVASGADPRTVELTRQAGCRTMDRIADIIRWKWPRPWRNDPGTGDEGTLDRTLEGAWPEPVEGGETGYRADLDHADTAGARTIGWERIIDTIWREDHRDPERSGPWTLGAGGEA